MLPTKCLYYLCTTGIKLKLSSIVIARAATIYHQFYFLCDISQFDHYVSLDTAIRLRSYLVGFDHQNIVLTCV